MENEPSHIMENEPSPIMENEPSPIMENVQRGKYPSSEKTTPKTPLDEDSGKMIQKHRLWFIRGFLVYKLLTSISLYSGDCHLFRGRVLSCSGVIPDRFLILVILVCI
jgi:hypothetical protein